VNLAYTISTLEPLLAEWAGKTWRKCGLENKGGNWGEDEASPLAVRSGVLPPKRRKTMILTT